MRRLFFSIVAALFSCAVSLHAQTSTPTIKEFSWTDMGIVQSMSDNGQWGLAQPAYDDDIENATARLINLQTKEETALQTTSDRTANGACTVSDVTDDGSIVVGSYKGYPAYWSSASGAWTILDSISGSGTLSAVTPDGKYAVGRAGKTTYSGSGVMYDLTTGSQVTLTNLPTKDQQHDAIDYTAFHGLSADGRYILAGVGYVVSPPAIFNYIYDVQEQKATPIGYTSTSDTEDWVPADTGIYFVDEACMSNNGKYVSGFVYTTTDTRLPFLYNVEENSIEVFNGTDDEGILGYAVTNDGTVLGTSPYSTPLREWYIRSGKYWVAVSDIFTQRYGTDFYTTTQYENTGFPTAVSDDGKTVIVTTDPTSDSYVVTFPESVTEIADGVNILGSYTVSPVAGSSFARMKEVEVTFARNIAVVGKYTNVALKDESGSTVCNPTSSGGVSASGKVLTLTFRPTKAVMEAGKKYTLEIGAGTVSVDGDASVTNEKISIEYNGRDNVAVASTSIYPADNSELSFIDYSSNAVYVTFDTYTVQKTDTATARLVNKTTGSKVCDLNMVTQDNMLAVYPTAKQYLYQGSEYQVIVDKGAVTDAQGYGGNDELVINYTGVYEREISSDDATLFTEDFSTSQSYNNFMLYEGDHNTPTTAMQGWQFDADNTPWYFYVHDDDSTNYCAASTSMYEPAGQSDNWMVIPQLSIPDEFCTLSFKGQSYLSSKSDSLKVIVWTCDENINTLTDDIIARIKSEGDVVFNDKLTPGENDGELAGDWVEYNINLSDYSGKNIYIAFVDENNDQSCLFIDDVRVLRELKYFLSLSNASSVVNLESIDIAGTLTANSATDTYTTATLTLRDSQGNQVGEPFTQTGLSLSKGEKMSFAFTTPLTLTVGAVNKFSIKVKLDNYEDIKNSSVRDLAFEPVKRVVLEEQTGMDCSNCPLGILAIENLESVYGDQFIPVSIHTYNGGDALSTGVTGYGTSVFGGNLSAPIGIVNRDGIISNPVWQNPLTAAYSFTDLKDGNCWQDYVEEELNTPADAELTLGTVTIDETSNYFSVPVNVRYALSVNNLTLNLFATVLEDNVLGSQSNNRYTSEDPLFGEWGKGGKYASETVNNYYHNDVARAYYGTSTDGTSGYFPQSMTAGETSTVTFSGQVPTTVNEVNNAKVVIMLLDATTGKVINAAVASFNPTSGIDDVNAGAEGVRVYAANGNIVVSTDGEASVSVYTIAGTQIASARTNGTATLSAAGYRGAAVVKVTTANGTVAKKLLVK